jgi:hypothetical protein
MLGPKGEVFEAIESASLGAGGKIWSIRQGDRVRAKHPALLANPDLFKPVDVGEPTHIKTEPVEESEQKPVRMVRAKQNLTVDGILVGGSFWTRGKTTINEGDELRADHPIVARNPKNFEQV